MRALEGQISTAADVRLHMFKSKIHRATVTHADLNYEGSVTVSGELLDAAQIHEYEQVHIWNVTRGTRLVTYAMRGDVGSGQICINGAAAHRAKPGDKVIISTFAEVPAPLVSTWKPKVVLVDNDNRLIDPEYVESAGPRQMLKS